MDLRERFKKEKGYDCYAYRQDYAGSNEYKDGFNDDYVKWLEEQVKNNVALLDEIGDITYNSAAQGCGLEDRGIEDRHEAMEYGWEQAIEACKETIENFD